ncbi:aminotransferase class I/II-fold pyridoxal phosphate-dependent enzyme [Pigmentibacter sp. JX0631]|uniref:aminotransferase class I/II-fold pyridoxal phosphate-dependent enzyme n=1 Tax=Pigmentibacter sp. JX0631 TaxID=2976982 RepID=UPI002468A77F|nr:aminotransferase class I/II-fold pyridoxal phosphate-dependent enzyme [Pigmentibacter sp. JX0631]WGL58796.1 aminotransferase class I/II-fold pyridoxal phosphate-dependent enzyme [Pigmentibacter sp. JX0631]
MRLPIFKLEEYLSEREFNCEIMFSGSDMETYHMHELLSLASTETLELWNSLKLSYTHPKGHPLLLEEINKRYNLSSSVDNICTFNGAEEGIFAAFTNILTKDDHAIVFSPCYQSLKDLPNHLCEVSELPIEFLNGQCSFNLDILPTLIKKNTKLIIINFPHNPTGHIISKNELNHVIDIARKHNLYIFSDEVYRGLEINKADQLPPVASIYEKGISLGVLSKSYGLPGLRIGWLASQDKQLMTKLSQFKHYLTICNGAPSEILAIIALQNEDIIYSRNKKIIEKNLTLLRNFFLNKKEIFEWFEPKGGCIAYPKLKLNISAYDFCEQFSQRQKVQLLPGDVFDHDKNHFRVGFGRLNMPEAIKRFENFLINI